MAKISLSVTHLTWVFIFVLYCDSVAANLCLNIDRFPCLCKLNEYSKIDLSPLISNNETLSYQNGDKIYLFSGCVDGEYNYTAKDEKNKTEHYSLLVAQHDVNKTMKIIDVFNTTQMNYETASDDPHAYHIVFKKEKAVATVHLICDNFKHNLLSLVEDNGSTLELALASPYSCVITKHPGLSTGSVLLILFFSCFGIYLFGGMLLLYFMRGARGIEIIPNIDFWKSLPGLVKDGVIFLLSGCRPTFVSTTDSYDRI